MNIVTINPEKFELLLKNFTNDGLKIIFKFIDVNSLPDNCKEILVTRGYNFLTKGFKNKFQKLVKQRKQAYNNSFEKVINETCQLLDENNKPDPAYEVEFYIGYVRDNCEDTEWIESDRFGFKPIKNIPECAKLITITFTQDFMSVDYIDESKLMTELTRAINEIHEYLDVEECVLISNLSPGEITIHFKQKHNSEKLLKHI